MQVNSKNIVKITFTVFVLLVYWFKKIDSVIRAVILYGHTFELKWKCFLTELLSSLLHISKQFHTQASFPKEDGKKLF